MAWNDSGKVASGWASGNGMGMGTGYGNGNGNGNGNGTGFWKGFIHFIGAQDRTVTRGKVLDFPLVEGKGIG